MLGIGARLVRARVGAGLRPQGPVDCDHQLDEVVDRLITLGFVALESDNLLLEDEPAFGHLLGEIRSFLAPGAR